MFLFLLVALPIFIATVYLCMNGNETAADTPRSEHPAGSKLKLTRNGFTLEVDELNYQAHIKKINQEKKEFAEKELKKTTEQKKEDAEREERGRLALAELNKLVIKDKDKKEELQLVSEPPKPSNDALDFFLELEKPTPENEPEVETEISSSISESIIGDVLSSSIGLPAPVFELATTLKDAVSDAPKPGTTMPTKRKRKGMGIS